MSQSVAQLQRKVKKPIIEKKRRERINKCLRELKRLVLNGMDADSSRQSAKMEKAEILELTVAYMSQLHGARCCSLSSDVITGAPRQKSYDDQQAFDSSSEEYRAGFTECLVHVQRFLADHVATAGAETGSEVSLPQQLINHFSQFVEDAHLPKDVTVRSSPPSPDTTLGVLPSTDAQPPPPSTSTSFAVEAHHSTIPRTSSLNAGPITSSLVQHQALTTILLPLNCPRSRLESDSAIIEQPSTSEYELQRRLRGGVFVSPQAIIEPLQFSLFSPSISMSVSSERSSPTRVNAATTCVQPASPDNAEHDVWRPWRPETSSNCSQRSDVGDTTSTL